MKPTAIRLALADLCPKVLAVRGFGSSYQIIWRSDYNDSTLGPVPSVDPLSAEAMVEILSTLTYEEQPVYLGILKYRVMIKAEGVSEWDVHTASQLHRAQAFLRLKNRWVEEAGK